MRLVPVLGEISFNEWWLKLRLVPVLLVLEQVTEWDFLKYNKASAVKLVTRFSPVKSPCACNFLLCCDQNVLTTSILFSKSEPVDMECLRSTQPE